ncbi:MAG: PIN domain-containing protein [Lapillicoccus sp.]
MRVLLDTSAVLGRRVPLEPDDEVTISAVTLAELHLGVLVAADARIRAERLRRLTTLERWFDPLPVDAAVAQRYGVLAAAVAEIGRHPRARAMDLLIAATASVHGARLVTRDAGDLRGLEGHLEILAL